MLMSKQSLLSDSQNLAQAAGSYYSTNILDLGAPGTPVRGNQLVRDVGKGTPIPFLIQVDETFASGGAATLVVSIEVDDNDSFSSATTVWTSPTIALATLAAGYRFNNVYLPEGVNERYARIKYVIGTAAMTAGKITAGAAMAIDSL